MNINIQTDLTNSTRATDRPEAVRSGREVIAELAESATSGPDRVDVSSQARSVANLLNQHSLSSAEKVQALKALVSGGEYQIDSMAISRAILSRSSAMVSGV